MPLLARAAWASLLLLAPGDLLLAVQTPVNRTSVAVTRALGLRHLGQAAGMIMLRDPRVRRWSELIDAAHGLTMAALAVSAPRYRGAGLTSLAVSSALVLAEGSPSSSE